MESSRSKNAKRNILFATINKVASILFPFVIRTVLLYLLGSEYLGLDSLFASILSFLSLAELGVGSALVFNMYKPIAENDSALICALLNLYRRLYRMIGFVILGIGVCLVPFLPHFVKGDCPADVNLYILYLVYLFNTAVSYWMFGYKRSLLAAHQRTDVDSKCTLVVQTVMYAVQIAALFLFRNYYWYILWLPVFTVISNLVVSKVTDKMYPELKCKGQISKELQEDIKKKVFALFGTKANSIVLHAFDTIVISAFLGLRMVALYGNYYYIMSAIVGVITIVYNSIVAGIGNSLQTETVEKNYFDFKVLTFANYWMVLFCTVSLLCLYQPFMELWMTQRNMLDMYVVILMTIYFYVYQIRKVILTYKDAGGIWWEDRYRPYIVMVVNLVCNLVMVQFIGIYGVILSTIISMIVSIPIENYTVFKYIFHLSSKDFYIRNAMYLVLGTAVCGLTYFACTFLPGGVLGLVLRALVCVIIPNGILFVLFFKTEEFKHAKQLLLRR